MTLLIAITINLFGTGHDTNVYDLFFQQSNIRGKHRFGPADPNTYQVMGIYSSILENVWRLLYSYHQKAEALPPPVVVLITRDAQSGLHFYLKHPEPYWIPSIPNEDSDDAETPVQEIANVLTGQQLSSEHVNDFIARLIHALER